MEVHVLASGSSGNAVYIKSEQTSILIDAGISARKITTALESVGASAAELGAVLITHEHDDHVKGLQTLLKSTVFLYTPNLPHGSPSGLKNRRLTIVIAVCLTASAWEQ